MKTKLLLFGITGDLSTRKLLPALSEIMSTGEFDNLEIIGVSRREVDLTGLLQSSLDSTKLLDKVRIFSMDLTSLDDYHRLGEYVDLQTDEQLLVYLSVPPQAATTIVDFMGEAGLNSPNVKILFEKPFGIDLESARDVIARTARYFGENQIYRIDHYLAKEMAQNIVAFRGGNAIFEHLWNSQTIAKIEIVALEEIGIEGRGQFYEQTGALRDVVQGHLMQLLALTLMDIPDNFEWDNLPALRLAALRQIESADPAKTKRMQYEGYQEEAENPGSLTETFVSLELESSAPQWQNIPLRLITGKAMDRKTTEVRIHFRKSHEAQSNRLILRIQPNEGVEIELYTKKPGYDRQFERQNLKFTYPEDTILPDAYEQVLVDAISSRKSLFTSSEEVLESWRILQPVQAAWSMESQPLESYQKGSSSNDL